MQNEVTFKFIVGERVFLPFEGTGIIDMQAVDNIGTKYLVKGEWINEADLEEVKE